MAFSLSEGERYHGLTETPVPDRTRLECGFGGVPALLSYSTVIPDARLDRAKRDVAREPESSFG
ncbi:hypothetical protein [Aestuariivirga sp.]|uniref:hypothetical protein n=1 Tax=Aestuariivirga sp. TaxID=2650926 RepID=UPI0039E2FF61